MLFTVNILQGFYKNINLPRICIHQMLVPARETGQKDQARFKQKISTLMNDNNWLQSTAANFFCPYSFICSDNYYRGMIAIG